MRTLDSKNTNHSRRKAANALLRSFSVNINRMLSLSTVSSPIKKKINKLKKKCFLQETLTHCEYYIIFCSLKVLYRNSDIRAVARKKKIMTEAMSIEAGSPPCCAKSSSSSSSLGARARDACHQPC